jgi:outer membrane beta-barrel protein
MKKISRYLYLWTVAFVQFVTFESLSAGFSVAQAQPQGQDDVVLPDKAPKVLQNRYFLKALRPELSVTLGIIANEAYAKTYSAAGRLGLFVTENLGLETGFTKYFTDESPDLKALRGIENCDTNNVCKSIEPDFVTLKSQVDVLGLFSPIYGKINFMDLGIVYSDIYFAGGAAFLQTSQGKKTSLIVGIGQRFYFAKSASVRFDVRDVVLQEERTNLGTKKKSFRHAWSVQGGISLFVL